MSRVEAKSCATLAEFVLTKHRLIGSFASSVACALVIACHQPTAPRSPVSGSSRTTVLATANIHSAPATNVGQAVARLEHSEPAVRPTDDACSRDADRGALSIRTESRGAVTLRALTAMEDGERQVYLAVDNAVVLHHRARDYVGHQVIRGHYDYDFLAVTVESGGPGTCIWDRSLHIYVLDQLVEDEWELLQRHVVALGDYLECADHWRSCGCGSWEATWTADTGEHETRIITSPHSLEHSTNAVQPPMPTVVIL